MKTFPLSSVMSPRERAASDLYAGVIEMMPASFPPKPATDIPAEEIREALKTAARQPVSIAKSAAYREAHGAPKPSGLSLHSGRLLAQISVAAEKADGSEGMLREMLPSLCEKYLSPEAEKEVETFMNDKRGERDLIGRGPAALMYGIIRDSLAKRGVAIPSEERVNKIFSKPENAVLADGMPAAKVDRIHDALKHRAGVSK